MLTKCWLKSQWYSHEMGEMGCAFNWGQGCYGSTPVSQRPSMMTAVGIEPNASWHFTLQGSTFTRLYHRAISYSYVYVSMSLWQGESWYLLTKPSWTQMPHGFHGAHATCIVDLIFCWKPHMDEADSSFSCVVRMFLWVSDLDVQLDCCGWRLFIEELCDHRSLTFVMWVSLSNGLEEARENPLVQEWGSNPETPDR